MSGTTSALLADNDKNIPQNEIARVQLIINFQPTNTIESEAKYHLLTIRLYSCRERYCLYTTLFPIHIERDPDMGLSQPIDFSIF